MEKSTWRRLITPFATLDLAIECTSGLIFVLKPNIRWRSRRSAATPFVCGVRQEKLAPYWDALIDPGGNYIQIVRIGEERLAAPGR